VNIHRKLLRIGKKEGMETFQGIVQLFEKLYGLEKILEKTIFMMALHIYTTF
jgi:hypothetical protein